MKTAITIICFLFTTQLSIYAKPFKNFDFSEGNLDEWEILDGINNTIVKQDYNLEGNNYFSTITNDKFVKLASPKFKVVDKHVIASISFYKEGNTDCILKLYNSNNKLLKMVQVRASRFRGQTTQIQKFVFNGNCIFHHFCEFEIVF